MCSTSHYNKIFERKYFLKKENGGALPRSRSSARLARVAVALTDGNSSDQFAQLKDDATLRKRLAKLIARDYFRN